MKEGAGKNALDLVELALIIEEATSEVRHDLRNKLGSIRNASYYVKRRLSKTETWAADPQLDAMTSLLDTDVAGASALLGRADERLHKRSAGSADVRRSVLDAVEHARVGPRARIQVEAPSGVMVVDAAELTVAVRCIVENAAEAMAGEGLVQVNGRIDGDRYFLDVVDHGPGLTDAAREAALRAFYTTKPGHAGLGLNVAQRVALRCHGRVVLGPSSSKGTTVSLVLELIKEGPHVEAPPG